MNFTREPIIETVITPREGCKLVLRNSKGGGSEEYAVEAVEVVSFGRSFFYRSVESLKPFLLPVTDYEILESKEARLALKNVQSDRQIKIGGGREAPLRPQQRENRRPEPNHREVREPRLAEEAISEPSATPPLQASMQQQQERKQGNNRRRRGRRGRGGDRPHDMQQEHSDSRDDSSQGEYSNGSKLSEGGSSEGLAHSEELKAPSFISKLFPPPPTLIKETLSRYKTTEEVEIFEQTDGEIKAPSREETVFDDPVKYEKGEDNFEDL